MSTRRLPGKVLHPVAGRPLLQFLVERLQRCPELDEVVVATSVEPGDEAVAAFCRELGVPFHRGPLEDVATRFLEVVEERRLDGFLRATADAPLLDRELAAAAVRRLRRGDVDGVTNVHPRSYPRGQSVEAVRSDAFRRAHASMREPDDREHVTRWLYRHAADVRIVNLAADVDRSGVQTSVDTLEDLRAFEAVVARMDAPHWTYGLADVLRLRAEAGLPSEGVLA